MSTETITPTEQDRTDLLRAVAKAEALIEAACDIGGPNAVTLHRMAGTYLRQAAALYPRTHAPDGSPR